MWNVEVYRILAAEKITRSLQEAQHDRQVRAIQEAAHHARRARTAAAPRVTPSSVVPLGGKEDPQTA